MNKNITSIVFAALIAGLFATSARAEDVKAGDLVISQEWARATPGGAKVGGGYLTIENKGATPDRLVGVAGAFGIGKGLDGTLEKLGSIHARHALIGEKERHALRTLLQLFRQIERCLSRTGAEDAVSGGVAAA